MTAREAARRALRRVEQGQAYATLALGGALEGLSPADRALATELCYGVLRHRARIDRALSAQAPRGLKLPPAVMAALRVAAYQLLFLRVAPHAAVDDGVDAVKRVAGERLARFANAILRKLSEPPPPTERWARLEALESLPRWIGERLPPGEAEAFAAAVNQPPPLSIRVQSLRIARPSLAERLAVERPGVTISVPGDPPEALLLRGAGSPEGFASFQEGLFTVQDVSAQRVGRLCGAAAGEKILDACAGVGGKTTHLQELAGGGAEIWAVDQSRRKLDLCEDSARRLGLGGIRTVAADLTAEAALLAAYDRVLLDAPCSGLGVLRRHPEAKWRPPPDVAGLAALQARLLERLAPRVRAGGVLVYSVCTFTDEEGPAQAAAFSAAHPEFRSVAELRTWPHRDGGDAFFAVRFERLA